MEPEIERIAETLASFAGGPAFVTCKQGCDLGVVRAGCCEHGESLNPLAGEDFAGVSLVVTVAGRVSAYFDALMSHGFSESSALFLTKKAQEILLTLSLGA
jgi:hypothetical protein